MAFCDSCYDFYVLVPNANHAFIDSRKLIEYCLNPTHPVGFHKAIVFRSALGFTSRDANTLRDILLRAVLVHEAVLGSFDEFGQRYTVDFPITTAFGFAELRSGWIVRFDEDFPRLTTCFVLKR